MFDSIQEGIRDAGALDNYSGASVKFVTQKEVKGTRLQVYFHIYFLSKQVN